MGSLSVYPSRSNIPEDVTYKFRGLGANGAALTLESNTGTNVTSGYTSEGIYTLTFGEHPGTFIGWNYALIAATPGDVKGYTVIADTWDSSTKVFTFHVFNGSVTLADLIADQYICLELTFRRSGVGG